MDLSRLADLSGRERDCLRLFWRYQEAGAVARELGRSINTVNGQLKSARRRLGTSSTREAARAFAIFEGHQTVVDPILVIPRTIQADDQAKAEQPHGKFEVRDGGALQSIFGAPVLEPPESRRTLTPGLPATVREIATTLVAIIAAVALIVFVMKSIPDAIAWNTFQF